MEGFNAFSASDRSVGPIFAAQPQVRESPVSVFLFPKIFIGCLCSLLLSSVSLETFIRA